jgi:hypothetical protein
VLVVDMVIFRGTEKLIIAYNGVIKAANKAVYTRQRCSLSSGALITLAGSARPMRGNPGPGTPSASARAIDVAPGFSPGFDAGCRLGALCTSCSGSGNRPLKKPLTSQRAAF